MFIKGFLQRFLLNFLVVFVLQEELSGIRTQLLQGFSPDDAYPVGAPLLFMETPRPCSPLAQMESQAFGEVIFGQFILPVFLV